MLLLYFQTGCRTVPKQSKTQCYKGIGAMPKNSEAKIGIRKRSIAIQN